MALRVVHLRDERLLGWDEMGDPEGHPVFVFHGTPGSRHDVLIDPAAARQTGARIIAADRPGCGASTFQPRRTFSAWADDVAELADHVGLERFAVMGVSGGGPYAAACARFLADRVSAVALVSAVAPIATKGSEAGMPFLSRMLVRAARRTPAVNAAVFMSMLRLVGFLPQRLLDRQARALPAADRIVLSRPEVRRAYLATSSHGSITATACSAAQDFGLFVRDWTFRLEEIAVPTHVWHGDADLNVPVAHARRQAAAIPNAKLHLIPGHGHLLSVDHLKDILRTLLASSK
jgi:pimeloyl-ACP methyl ester carboxylesterase